MAIDYTPEEIQRIFDEYHRNLAQGIPITKELAEELADAKKGVKNYTYNLNQSLKQLGQTTKQTIGDIAKGAKGVSTFNDAIDSAGTAAANFAAGFGPIGIAIGLVVKALSFFVQTANKQSDKLFDAFQDLSRSGTVGAQGMTDVFQSMKRFGYTIDELDKMTAVLAENSRDLAQFGGTAAQGGKQLSNLVDGFKDYRVQLQSLGLSTDEQVRAAAGYYKQMGRLGRATEATSAGAVAYIKEMETLTRLTGQQRKELEAQREAAENIDAFQAALADADPRAAENMRQTFNMLSAVDPEMAQGYAESVNGIITGSEAQMKYLRATNFEGLEIAQRTTSDFTMTADKVGNSLAELYKGNERLSRDFAKVGITDYFGKRKTFQQMGGKDFVAGMNEATKEVNQLGEHADAATDAQARARVSQIDASNSMQSFVNLGVSPATQALAALSDVVENLTSLLPGGGPENKGYGKKGTGTFGKSLAATGAGAAAGAAAGSLLGPIGTVIGGIVGGVAGATGYNMTGGTDAITGKSLGNLNDDFKSRFLQAANEYYQTTGNKVQVTSAFRDSEKQAQLYADYQAGRSKFPAAPPGKSKHESGRALDIDLATANKMDEMGLLKKYGLSRPVADDPIHIEGYAGFRGALSGPMSGYRPNLLMHGNEELSVRPMGAGSTSSNSTASEGTMIKLVEKLDDLIGVSKNQLSVNEKILKYQH